MSEVRFDDRVAIGTGAGSAMADQVVTEIKAAGGEAVPDYHGVNTAEGGEAIVQAALDAYGKVNILINNAGILRDRAFHNLTEEDWEKVLAVHLKGAFCVTQPAFRVMRQNQYGRIVFTTSAAGLYGNFGQTNYGAAKMALVGLMNTLKIEGQKYNIKANTIAPLAAYLCSEECEDSGTVFTAAAGYFGRAATVESKGVFFDDAGKVSIEDVR